MSFLLIKIGQNDQNDVILNDPSIASEHAEIFVDVEGNVFLTDLNTGKNTFVNGKKLIDSIELKSIDKITLGTDIDLDWKSVLAINQPKTITVGRGNSNDFVIDAPSVSENHLQLIQDQNDSCFISDLASENGTYINGNRISEIALLKAGDVVHVGDELFLWKSVFSDSSIEKENTVEIQATEPVEVSQLIDENNEVESVIANPNPVEFEVETEEVDVAPELIDFTIKTEAIKETVVEKPMESKSVVELVIDTVVSESEQNKSQGRKKELIQLAIIVAADILILIFISSMI